MKIKFLVFGLLFCGVVAAQKFGDTSSFVLKGKIQNLKKGFFEYAITGFFDNSRSSIVVNSDGSFSKTITIENRQQNIYLSLNNNVLTFTVKKNDTIDLSWDDNNCKNTFNTISRNAERQNALKIQWLQFLNFRQANYALQEKLYKDKTLTDSAKFVLINNLFNQELKLIADSSKYSNFSMLLFPNVYFQYSNLLFSYNLIPRFRLTEDTALIKNEAAREMMKYTSYSDLSEELFWTNSTYRDFMFDYPRLYRLFNSYSGEGQNYFNPTLSNYYLAKGKINIVPIKNWFITKCILDDYGFYKFNDVDSVNKMFQKELTDPYLKQLLINKHTAMITLKKGQPAPAFTLQNEKGENVSLGDFRGKILYLDFWGVGCGPCVYEIDNYEKKLHEKYKGKNVSFISICVDSDLPEWKAGMQKHDMNNEGINLVAEGWTNNPVCKSYNINTIPHRIIIDKEGKIVNNNAPGMGELLQKNDNEIDELLVK